METTYELMAVINAATRIVAARILSMLCLVMTCGLASWAMILQTILGSVIAGGFAILVFLPCLWAERRKGD